ncbi:zf-DHHC-domain-containing protein [Auriscalpium vulgare]|uniref:Zf-DHHC-domain-containing protein n=1 Tax=Auriscalpium vulgare TaxID=40419 RepID=A0ACB8RBG1_9AGAM|nr:zf-DHHC-domain-containing protein [Auriscalpium vulgare]
MTGNNVPLLTFPPGSLGSASLRSAGDAYNEDDDGQASSVKRWYHYLPLCLVIFCLLIPHPSLLHVLIHYHLLVLDSPLQFTIHLLTTYTLTFAAFSSLIVCVARDPGPVPDPKHESGDGEDMTLEDALMAPPPADDYLQPGRWCKICWAPKPERAHHCSACGRCVLKMDHHCPWVGAKCIGHRTYPSFVHLLASVTLLALYIASVNISGLWYAFSNPLSMGEVTPVHMLFLAFMGIVVTMIIGSFFGYHVYLILTNQTTIENISSFHILRHLPPLPPSKLSSPPYEHELSFDQRRLVRAAHRSVRMYDIGWRRNWAQVFAPAHNWRMWLARVLWGGACVGNGQKFPLNPRADEMLARLAEELVKLEQDRG